jgi:prepilin-type N-terminal cleavage/methylation domain-containing protein
MSRHAEEHPTFVRRAFTLVELIITIGVIVILTALTVSATIALTRRSEIDQTRMTLAVLDLALGEWRAEADRRLSWGDNPLPPEAPSYDIGDGTPHVFTASEVWRRISTNDAARTILAQISADLTYVYGQSKPIPPWLPMVPEDDDPDPFLDAANPRYLVEAGLADGSVAVLDAWGEPIRAVHPGRLFESGDTGEPDPDGTIFISQGNSDGWNEQIYGRARNRRLYFVSAGPDRKWGDLSAAQERIQDQAADNLYSYRLDEPKGGMGAD